MNKIMRLAGMFVGFSLAVFCMSVGFAMAAGGHGGGMNFGAIGGLIHLNENLYFRTKSSSLSEKTYLGNEKSLF